MAMKTSRSVRDKRVPTSVSGSKTSADKAIALPGGRLERKALGVRIRTELEQRPKTFCFFGHFGFGNFGNESTLQAILQHLRGLLPDVEISCICTGPATAATTYNITTVPISGTVLQAWRPHNHLAGIFRSAFIGIPSELYRWLEALIMLKGVGTLIIPGTGLLTDAYGLKGWGPYGIFKWSVIAKLCGCKLFFVSVGAGPIYGCVGRWLVRSALALADFRSYRDNATKEYLSSIGARVADDRVYPDLAFSIAEEIKAKYAIPRSGRPVVGLGLMLYDGKLSVGTPRESICTAYFEQLIVFVKWLLAQNYDIRLLIGDLCDEPVTTEFKALLKHHLEGIGEDRIIDEPVRSVADLLAQIAQTDTVVATRFHNVLLALVLNKPVISISFHQKCTSLMHSMELQEYCQDIQHLNSDRLIEQFCQLQKNMGGVRRMISRKVAACRRELDEQYNLIFEKVLPR
jgi:polysaccharide pyruvyl transferase WcaK-like protein